MKLKSNIFALITLVLSVVLAAGSATFISACPVSGEHTMVCHWAQIAVTSLAAVLAVISLIAVVIPDEKIKTGVLTAVIPVSVLTFLIPGTLIHLCMMESMRCLSVFQPAVRIFAAVILIVALAGVIRSFAAKKES